MVGFLQVQASTWRQEQLRAFGPQSSVQSLQILSRLGGTDESGVGLEKSVSPCPHLALCEEPGISDEAANVFVVLSAGPRIDETTRAELPPRITQTAQYMVILAAMTQLEVTPRDNADRSDDGPPLAGEGSHCFDCMGL